MRRFVPFVLIVRVNVVLLPLVAIVPLVLLVPSVSCVLLDVPFVSLDVSLCGSL